ncbi:P-loop containing nucleoside triphosphate hydrolase protein [Dactylonectria macrodidyma]|uniref:P-loop containing nucleoside triphosphate hydrolase protein n=1 Tax=Dactylonectria macrodidyma TaxID=307937 RepID=A0A9P9F8U3_9HYPO|nr:P-loop containing nucleoside triphosphate hydrolase protein [Dactylonectria macrodidyma]
MGTKPQDIGGEKPPFQDDDTSAVPTLEVPSAEESEEGAGFSTYVRIFTYAGTSEYLMQAVALVAAVISGAGIALQTLIFGKFVTAVTDFVSSKTSPAEFRDTAAQLALYFVYLGSGRLVLSYTYNSLLTYAAHRIIRTIRQSYLRSALRQEIAFFDSDTGGSIATQATSNGQIIHGGISEKLGLTFQGLSAFITAFIIAFIIEWKLTLICLCMAPATLIVNGAAAGIMAGHETKILEIHAQANSFAENILSSVRTIHAFEMQGRLVKKFDHFLADAHRVGSKISPLFGLLFSSEYCIIYLGYGLAFWQGGKMLARGEIEEPGVIFTVLLSVIIAATNLTVLAPYAIDFTRATSAAAKLFQLIDRVSCIDPFDPNGTQPLEICGDIELHNVTFAYPMRPEVPVLNDFSLKIPAGKVTALVGQSGSGKSTVIGLLERWYTPSSGTIKLDGHPIDQLNLNWLRRNVRLVQQEPVLFQGTIFENIKHGLVSTRWENASKKEQLDRIQEAARLAFAHDFICELAEGYNTQIGQRGSLLSGGQKQRIAIARSIVSQPKILLLDEATSALDPKAEGIVQQALDRASEGRTTLVIAHKLATIQKADNIVVMAKGQIVEQGTHEALIANDDVYARLVKMQNLGIATPTIQPASPASGSVNHATSDPDYLSSVLSRHANFATDHVTTRSERYDYSHYKQQGIISVIAQLVLATPELSLSYFFVLASCALAGATFPGQAILLSNVMEVFTLTGSEMERKVNFYATMFVVLAAGCLVAYFALGYATNVVAHHLSHKFRKQILQHILRQDVEYFDRAENNTGALVSRIDSNPQSILELMGYNIGLILVCLFNVTACSILAIVYSWKLGLVVVCAGLPPLVGAGYFKIRFDAKLDRDLSKRYATSASIASEAVAAIRTLSSLAIEELVLKNYTDELDRAVVGSKHPLFSLMTCFAFTQAVEYWFMALGYWYGCRLLSLDEISIYAFFVAFLGVFFSGQAATQLFQYSTSITKGLNAANYVLWLESLEPVVRETPENRHSGPPAAESLAVDNVHFSYPLRPDTKILKGINLNVEKGQFIALVGPSGCGKSTMIAMLERFYDPTTGSICIDTLALPSLNPRLYRQSISLVQQEPMLFQGSIRQNVALGVDDAKTDLGSSSHDETLASDERIESALRDANAWDFVSSLPEGLSTLVGSSGTQLSGGQRQRIAIARALIRNPRILLLDEATSALDTESEKVVQSALSHAAKSSNRITFAVAHRFSTIKDADMICVFYGGKIVEMGTHEELIEQDSMYRKMCEAQALD